MTSQLNVDTIADKAGSGPVGLTKQKAAKVLWDVNGTGTIALLDSFNVSSAADLATGYYQINYTNAFDTANNMPLSGTLNFVDLDVTLTIAKTASSMQVYTLKSTDATAHDSKPFGATDGDLA